MNLTSTLELINALKEAVNECIDKGDEDQAHTFLYALAAARDLRKHYETKATV